MQKLIQREHPGLVVNAEDSQSEPWSSDVGLNPGFTSKLDGKDGPSTWWQKNNENNKDSQMGQVTPKKFQIEFNIVLAK